jgi:hypothetical protein
LFGDQYVLWRDLDPTDGGGNGEPMTDDNGQLILVGSDGLSLFPIYYEETAEGDFIIPEDMLAYVQEVELGRANVARAPTKVMEKSLNTALAKIDAATVVDTDAAGRIVCDGVTIDSPLENLALYKFLMTAGGHSSWPDVSDHWPAELRALLGADSGNPDWDPSSLLGAAFDKAGQVTLDAMLYENTTLGVNSVIQQAGGGVLIDYFDFSNAGGETYNYDRAARFDGVMLQWFADTDGDPTNLELVEMSLMEAVFGGANWTDDYLEIGSDPNTFVTADASGSGANDFAQAADDARAVISFMHDTGAVEIAPLV